MNNRLSEFKENIDIENIDLQLFSTIGYIILSTDFIINLNSFNKKIDGKNVFEIMTYDGGRAWGFLIGSILLVCICGLLLYLFWQSRHSLETFEEQIIVLILLVIVIVIGILIIYYIQNPILRAALTCILVGAAIFSSRT